MKTASLWRHSKQRLSSIGIDIGSAAIKVVQLEQRGRDWGMKLACVVEHQGENLVESEATELRRLLKSQRVRRPWRAVSALPGPEAEIRRLSMPAGDPSTLPRRTMEIAERALPFGTEDTIIDFVPLGRSAEAGEEQDRVLLAAASRESVDRHLAFVRQVGMLPEAVELTPWALARSVRLCGMQPEGQTYAVLDVGHTTSTIIIFDEEGLFLSRSIPAGSRNLTGQLERELDLTWSRAEQLKSDRGLTLAARSSRTAARDEGGTMVAEILDDLLLPALGPLVEEVERSLAYHSAEKRGEALEHLILVGGGAKLRNLDLFLGDHLGIPVRVIQPGQDDSLSISEGTGREAGWPVLATAVGLALRGLSQDAGNRRAK